MAIDAGGVIGGAESATVDTVGRVAILAGTGTLRVSMAKATFAAMNFADDALDRIGRIVTRTTIASPDEACVIMTLCLIAGDMLMTVGTVSGGPVAMGIATGRHYTVRGKSDNAIGI